MSKVTIKSILPDSYIKKIKRIDILLKRVSVIVDELKSLGVDLDKHFKE